MRSRHPRPNINLDGVWRPFGDHNYPRNPDAPIHPDPPRPPTESISPAPTLSPDGPVSELPRTNTPYTFPSDYNYPLSESPREEGNPIADHTYPRDPQNQANSDYLAPLVSSLQSTISHISMQTNLLRRQVESIELIDRARYEFYQLQEMRRMWEDIRRHVNALNTASSERRSNITNVRQMMAWTRISDPSPSSESAQSSTEQSTPEPSPSTPDVPTPSTSRSSASSGNESRTLNPNSPSYILGRFRQNHVKKRAQSRLFWRRRTMRNEQGLGGSRRYSRVPHLGGYRGDPRGLRNPSDASLTEVTVSLMIRNLETLLSACRIVIERREARSSPDRSGLERRVLSERVIENRLRSARQRLNMLNGYSSSQPSFGEPVGRSVNLGSRTDWTRYEARLKLSVYIETFSRFAESRTSPLPQALYDQVKILIELALLLTDLLLLQVMLTNPALSGSFLNPEREILAGRIEQMCTNLLQTISHSRLSSLARILHSLRLTARYVISSLRFVNREWQPARGSIRRILDLNRQLRRELYQFGNYLSQDTETTTAEPIPSTSQDSNQQISYVYRLCDLLTRIRNVRGRLEQGTLRNRLATSSSTTEPEPTRSTDESPSDDRESESLESFTEYRSDYIDPPGALYRTSHVNLYPPEQSSSQSSPERLPQTVMTPRADRPWNVPTVQVNDVPVTASESSIPPTSWQSRIMSNRYLDHIRPLSAATGLFRPRFLIPLYAGVNPFDADLDEGQREPPNTYDGIMTTTVNPVHRIQMWDISKCCIPNISNREYRSEAARSSMITFAFPPADEKNIVVSECKIHNDGSVDISRDGTLLVTLLPSGGYLNVTNRLGERVAEPDTSRFNRFYFPGIYSIKWDTLGQCLYTTSFEQNAISVSLSPISRHLIVGLASRRVTLLPSERWTMARIFLLDDRKIKITGRGRLVVLRDLEQGRDRDLNFMSVNCIKWIPVSGQGIVYATNTGQLKVLT